MQAPVHEQTAPTRLLTSFPPSGNLHAHCPLQRPQLSRSLSAPLRRDRTGRLVTRAEEDDKAGSSALLQRPTLQRPAAPRPAPAPSTPSQNGVSQDNKQAGQRRQQNNSKGSRPDQQRQQGPKNQRQANQRHQNGQQHHNGQQQQPRAQQSDAKQQQNRDRNRGQDHGAASGSGQQQKPHFKHKQQGAQQQQPQAKPVAVPASKEADVAALDASSASSAATAAAQAPDPITEQLEKSQSRQQPSDAQAPDPITEQLEKSQSGQQPSDATGVAEAAGDAAAAVSPSEAAAEVAKADLSDTPPSSVGEPGDLQAAGDTQSTPHAASAGAPAAAPAQASAAAPAQESASAPVQSPKPAAPSRPALRGRPDLRSPPPAQQARPASQQQPSSPRPQQPPQMRQQQQPQPQQFSGVGRPQQQQAAPGLQGAPRERSQRPVPQLGSRPSVGGRVTQSPSSPWPRNRVLDTLDEQDESILKEAEDVAFSSWDLPEDEKVEAPAKPEASAEASGAATQEAAPARPTLRLAARPKVAPRPATEQERQDQALTDAARGPPAWRRPSQPLNGASPAAAPGQAATPGAAAPAPGTDRFAGRKDRRRTADDDDDDDSSAKKKGKKPDAKGKTQVRQRRATKAEKRQQRFEAEEFARPEREEIFEIPLQGMSLQELADRLATGQGEIIASLFRRGIMVQVNSVLDVEAVKLVAEDFGAEGIDADDIEVSQMAKKTVDYDDGDEEGLQPRAPVVTVMGHVDHGKTSLLDFVRNTKVAAGEAGGITQAIGAYTCMVGEGESEQGITFLDTPGHEAFSAMRARGTRVTDIAIIVVAADDGVRPQTSEAIGHAQSAGVPIVIAINKMDKEGAQPDRVKQELSDAGLLPEEWGGQTPMIQISAKKGNGIDELLETVLLVAEVAELRANPDKPARGTVIEAHLDRRIGPVATMLVATGTLHVGDIVSCGVAYGKVRQLLSTSAEVDEAGPSDAVQMFGLSAVPKAGDEFVTHSSLEQARKSADQLLDAQRTERLADLSGGSTGDFVTSRPGQLEDLGDGLQRLNIILKADTSGSMEAVKATVQALPSTAIMPRFLLSAANEINTSDVDLAYNSQAIILGFNVEPSEAVIAAAKQKQVPVHNHRVIYDLMDTVRGIMEGRLAPVEQVTEIGSAQVRAVFGSGSRKIAGCMVNEGSLKKGCTVEVKRNRKTITRRELVSLRRVKDDVKEVSAGNECGLRLQGFDDFEEGDQITALEIVQAKRTLEDAADLHARAASAAREPAPV